MAGTCKQCGGQTTNTRAKSALGKCFNCEHGLVRETPRDAYLEDLRQAQTNRVMPLIGPLLDAWEGCPNDMKSEIEDLHLALYSALQNVVKAVENDD